MGTTSRSIVIAAALATLSTLSLADDQSGDSERSLGGHFLGAKHIIFVGTTRQSMDAEISAAAEGFDPITLKLEDLGVENRDTSYYVEYRYRFKPRWAMIAGAYSFSGSGNRTSQRDFNYDGIEFSAGSEIETELDIKAYIVDVMYTLSQSDSYELLIGGGVHALDLGATIAGQVFVGNETSEFRQSGTTLLAPVPNIRSSFTWAATQRLALSVAGGWLSANVDSYEGDFIYAHLRANYQISEHFGVVLGYQRTNIDITDGECDIFIRQVIKGAVWKGST
jgi:hypothetical protein